MPRQKKIEDKHEDPQKDLADIKKMVKEIKDTTDIILSLVVGCQGGFN